MKLITLLALLMLTSAITAQDSAAKPSPQASPKMTPEERAQAIKLLKDSEKQFLDLVENVTDAQWNYKHEPINGRDRWSIAECAEHIMLSEAAIFGRVE